MPLRGRHWMVWRVLQEKQRAGRIGSRNLPGQKGTAHETAQRLYTTSVRTHQA